MPPIKIPKSFDEIKKMSPEQQEVIGEMLGRLVALKPTEFEKTLGLKKDDLLRFIREDRTGQKQPEEKQSLRGILAEFVKQQPKSPEQQPAAPTKVQPPKDQPKPVGRKKTVLNVRDGKRRALPASGPEVVIGPFEVVMQESENGNTEIVQFGSQAKKFLTREG